MFVQLTCIIVDADEENRNELAAVLQGMGVTVLERFDSIDTLQQYLQVSEGPQLICVNLDPNAQEMLRELGSLPRMHAESAFFVMSQMLDPQLLMKSMSMGVREFIPLPMTEDTLVEALERVAQIHGAGKAAKIIQVVPTVGGCGSTTIACNMAASLAQQGHRTCIVDLDLIRGGVASYFDLRPTYTIADVMESADRVDQQLVENGLINHDTSGLRVMARPELPEESQRVTQAGVKKLISVLGRMFEYVIIDSMMSVDPVYATAITAADINVVVMQLNVPSAKNAERYVGTLRRMGIEASKINLIVNRFVKKGWDIEPSEVERSLGLSISWLVPNDYKNALSAINYGEPVVLRAPKSEMSQSLLNYSRQLTMSAKDRKAA